MVKQKIMWSKEKIMSLLGIIFTTLLITSPAFAAKGGQPTIVIGTKNLFTDAGTWVLIIVPVGAACMLGWHALAKSMSEGDPAVIAEKNKKMRNVLIGAIIAETAVSIVTVVLSYYTK